MARPAGNALAVLLFPFRLLLDNGDPVARVIAASALFVLVAIAVISLRHSAEPPSV